MLVRFEAGDKVWIERTEFVENVDMIRSVQTVESVMDCETDEPNSQVIYLIGSDYIFSNEDLKKDK